MPTYEYLCAKCGHRFDLVQSIAADALKECPKDHCTQKRWGHGHVKRQITAGSGLLFKGTGFYITDYRSEGYKAAAKKDADSGSGGSTGTGSTSSGSESKPAAKPEAKTEAKTEAKADKPAKPASTSAGKTKS